MYFMTGLKVRKYLVSYSVSVIPVLVTKSGVMVPTALLMIVTPATASKFPTLDCPE